MTRIPFTYTWIEQGTILAGSIPQLPDDLNILQGLGIKRIISLTRRNILTYPNMVLPKGMYFGQYPIPDGGIADDKTMQDAYSLVGWSYLHNLPTYVHCRGGIGRTGIILQAFYINTVHITLEQARDKVRVRRNYEGNADASMQGSPQREWIEALWQSLSHKQSAT